MPETIEIDGESTLVFSVEEEKETLARLLEDELLPGEPSDEYVIDAGPEGWRYFSDVMTPETIEWLRVYGAEHPDDEFIQDKILDNERHARESAARRSTAEE